MITIPDAMRRPAEVERDELKKQLAEALAEIEILKNQLEDESMRADGMTTAHAEAGADSYRMRELIEQMREALERTMVLLDAVPTYAQDFAKDEKLKQIGRMVNTDGLYALVRDALSAAERDRK